MNESVQAVLCLILIVGIFGSIFAWALDQVHWALRIGFPAAAAAAGVLLLWSLLRRDKVPDFLKKVGKPRYERDGFSFVIAPSVAKGQGFITVLFQNRYERACRAYIVLQPSKGFFLNRAALGTLVLEIECPGGGFGRTDVPWGIPKKFQGSKRSLDIAAQISYPEGRGKLIRYRGGLRVGMASFDVWKVVLTVAAAAGGSILLFKPAHIKISVPQDVEETVADEAPIVTKILWKLGDPPGMVAPAL